MNNENKKLLEKLNSNTADFTREEIELMIEEEMEKDPEEIDEVLIDTCVAALAKYDDDEYRRSRKRTVTFNLRRLVALVAVLTLIVSLTVATASTKEGYQDIKSDNVRLENGQYILDLSEDAKTTYPTQKVKEFEEVGLDGVVIPKALLSEEYEIEDIVVEQFNNISISYKTFFISEDDKDKIGLAIEKNSVVNFNEDLYKIILKDSFNKAIQICNVSLNVYIFGSNSDCMIFYATDKSLYQITLYNIDFESAVKIAETI